MIDALSNFKGTTWDLVTVLGKIHGPCNLTQTPHQTMAKTPGRLDLKGKTMKQYVKEKVRPSVEADWDRLKQSPGWRKSSGKY